MTSQEYRRELATQLDAAIATAQWAQAHAKSAVQAAYFQGHLAATQFVKQVGPDAEAISASLRMRWTQASKADTPEQISYYQGWVAAAQCWLEEFVQWRTVLHSFAA